MDLNRPIDVAVQQGRIAQIREYMTGNLETQAVELAKSKLGDDDA